MVAHGITAQGVDLKGNTGTAPVLLQLNSEDFQVRFLQDVLTQSLPASVPPISSAAVVDFTKPLYQPVQRILHIAMAQLSCNTVGNPRLDPTRVISAGLVIRRVYRASSSDRPDVLQAWMRSPLGRFQWSTLDASTENLDPDPTKRAQRSPAVRSSISNLPRSR